MYKEIEKAKLVGSYDFGRNVKILRVECIERWKSLNSRFHENKIYDVVIKLFRVVESGMKWLDIVQGWKIYSCVCVLTADLAERDGLARGG